MRANCAYGLERFWGEHLRLADKEPNKAQFVIDVWTAFVGIMAKAKVKLPGTMLARTASEAEIQSVAEYLWRLERDEQQASLAVLTSLCDSVVWWTQRLKTGKGSKKRGSGGPPRQKGPAQAPAHPQPMSQAARGETRAPAAESPKTASLPRPTGGASGPPRTPLFASLV